MLAPSLWLYEVTNVLVLSCRRGRIPIAQRDEALHLLLGFEILLEDPPIVDVYADAFSFGLTAYDAAYVALARAKQAQLWTGDRRLWRSLRSGGADFAHWIGEYAPGR